MFTGTVTTRVVDSELGQEAPEVEEEEQGRGDGAEEEGVACHICLMQISTGEQESGMMLCDCDISFLSFEHKECFHDFGCPSEMQNTFS